MNLLYTIDLGQLILILIGILVSTVAWFTKKDIIRFGSRLDKHDEVLFTLAGSVQRLIGFYEGSIGKEHKRRESD